MRRILGKGKSKKVKNKTKQTFGQLQPKSKRLLPRDPATVSAIVSNEFSFKFLPRFLYYLQVLCRLGSLTCRCSLVMLQLFEVVVTSCIPHIYLSAFQKRFICKALGHNVCRIFSSSSRPYVFTRYSAKTQVIIFNPRNDHISFSNPRKKLFLLRF